MMSKETKQPSPTGIGERLKEIRFKNNWTLQTVSNKTGIAPSIISKLENGQGVVNIVTLQKLCFGLNLSMDRLTRPTANRAPGVRAVNVEGSGTVLSSDRVSFNVLSEDMAQKEMFPVLITTKKTVEDNPKDEWISFQGERFIFVVEGSIQLISEFYTPLTLKKGESVQFDAAMEHGVVSANNKPATFLSVSFDATGRARTAPYLANILEK